MKFKSLLFSVVIATVGLCALTDAQAAKIGVSLPNNFSQSRWFKSDGPLLQQNLESKGHSVVVSYAGNNDIILQKKQITQMIDDNCEILIISPIDSSSLLDVLDAAKQKNIPVVAYDRIIIGSSVPSYLVSFDSREVGKIIGQYVIDHLNFNDAPDVTRNIEVFAGSANDLNSSLIGQGLNDVISPYIVSGKITSLSSDLDFDKNSTQDWSKEYSRRRMNKLVESFGYVPSGTRLDAVICFSDAVARGVIDSLESVGFKPGEYPVITGQDCDRLSLLSILHEKQSMSVFKDIRELARVTASLVDDISHKRDIKIDMAEAINNGVKQIPSILLPVILVDKDNMKKVLVDSGYLKENELEGF